MRNYDLRICYITRYASDFPYTPLHKKNAYLFILFICELLSGV